jgi:peptidylprolyl isomerase
MSRFRRTAAAVSVVMSTVLLLASCGEESSTPDDAASETETSSSAVAGELDEVSFAGEVGKELTATWQSEVAAPTETTVTTLVEGDGEAIADGDTVSTYLWVGNGSTKKDVFSTYDQGAPEQIPFTEDLDPVFKQLIEGSTYGSRVVAVTTAEELFGENAANNQLGVGEKDTLVVVADLVEKAAVAPTPTDDAVHDVPASELPTVVETGGEPTGLDFSGIEEPALDTPVQRVVLKKGTGATVKATDTVKIDYLGATYEASEPFDESYSGTPLTSPLSGLIRGWSIGLTGVKIGSRVLIQIPPAYGYGAQGSGAIGPNATLWFVIDVLAVE